MPPDSLTAAIDPTAMRAQTRVGTVLRSKWHLDVLLGVGGMAAVYAATHRNGTRAALKVLHPELSTHAHIRSRFFREGRVANTIGHPGAVKVVDEDEAEDGSIFLVMELLEGESLDARAQRSGGKLPADEVLAAADQILDVLAAAHDKGVVHRDLKPENVFLTREGVVKLLDFGIARLREYSTASSATRTGTSMGTPMFMPPEQARGLWDEVDARSDLWAVGALMFALLTGRTVHEGRTTNELLLSAMTNAAPPLLSLDPGAHAAVSAVVDRALAFEKDLRWPDARTMQNAVRHAYLGIHDAPISTAPKLQVPPSVTDRTLPTANAVAPAPGAGSTGTGPALASGRTGVALRKSANKVQRRLLLVVTIAGAGALLALAFVLVGAVTSRVRGTPVVGEAVVAEEPLPGEASSSNAIESESMAAEADPPGPSTTAGPSAQQPAPLAPKADAGVKARVPRPRDWKEQRR